MKCIIVEKKLAIIKFRLQAYIALLKNVAEKARNTGDEPVTEMSKKYVVAAVHFLFQTQRMERAYFYIHGRALASYILDSSNGWTRLSLAPNPLS